MANTPEYERRFGSSPIYRQKNAATVAANATFTYNWEISDPNGANKYLPFNSLVVINNDVSSALELYVNGDLSPIKYILPGTVVSFDKKVLPAFYSFMLKNVGSTTIAIGDIEVVAQREAITQDDIAREQHAAQFGKKYRGNTSGN